MQLRHTAAEVNRELEARRFNEASRRIYHFVWNQICDWYIEFSKPMLNGERGKDACDATHATIYVVLAHALKLLHPFMPFATEEIWHALPNSKGSIMSQPYPEFGDADDDWTVDYESALFVNLMIERAEPLFTHSQPSLSRFKEASENAQALIAVIDTLRTVRGENGIKPRTKVNAFIAAPDAALRTLYGEHESQLAIQTLAGVETITIEAHHGKQEGEAHGVGGGFEVFIPLAGMIDVDAERQRLERETKKISAEISKLAAKLANPNFTGKAPAAVVEKNRGELATLETQLAKLNASLRQLSGA
jgi:valyl-tRNA synthetase